MQVWGLCRLNSKRFEKELTGSTEIEGKRHWLLRLHRSVREKKEENDAQNVMDRIPGLKWWFEFAECAV
jgi:hypothetical protein